MSISAISPLDLRELHNSGARFDLIDVRTPMEFQELHVVGARNVPLDQLDPGALMQSRKGSSQAALYVICRSGSRGKQACEKILRVCPDTSIKISRRFECMHLGDSGSNRH